MKPEYNVARFTAPARNTWCGNVSEERARNAARVLCDSALLLWWVPRYKERPTVEVVKEDCFQVRKQEKKERYPVTLRFFK